MRRLVPLLSCLLLASCGSSPDDGAPLGAAPSSSPDPATAAGATASSTDPWSRGPSLGARRLRNGDLEVRARAPHATRLEVCLFAKSQGESEKLRIPMEKSGDRFTVHVAASELRAAGLEGVLFYGLRAFGPNFPYDAAWTPGSLPHSARDVDAEGNRMNPNKLLLDPYALEVSHDPTGDGSREVDSGPFAPKGVVVDPPERATNRPTRARRDDVVYEVHVRGLTKADPTVPEAERGTYAGAARRARYLRELGVTTIELLPLHETPNDQNDRTPDAAGDNYWGYSTVSFFAPDRRYSADRSPGGPTRELRAMVDAFHAEGIKVWVDVVFNHTAEGGGGAYSFRGLDNATFYELADDATKYVNGNGVGPNFNTANPVAADLVLDSLRYWREILGIDGFRFDLATIVGNRCARGCYAFDRDGLVKRIAEELPARPDEGGDGADLVAEPWGLAPGSYQVGGFPKGWSEWNDKFRDTIRRDLNRLDVDAVTPRELARRLSGSPDLFADDGRPPSSSINFVVAHDGMTLADLFSYDRKQNAQAWPFGPSNGGTDDDLAFSHGGDPRRQRSAARTAFALAAVSAGVPMITGGDERLRTLRGNNNPYNLDSPGSWLDWTPDPSRDAFHLFASRALAFRAAHPALRPAKYWSATDARFLRDDAATADGAYLDNAGLHYLGMLVDDVFVAYSGLASALTVTLPAPPPGKSWWLAGDTSEDAEAWGNWLAPGKERRMDAKTYGLGRRTLAVFVAR